MCHGVAEEMCWSALEAMSCAVPAVLADASCYRQFADTKDFALFSPADNPIALGNRLVMLATRIDLRTELGQLGRQVAISHDIERHGDELEQHLQSMIPQGRSLLERAASGEVEQPDHDQPLIHFGSDYRDVKYRLGISLLEAAILASTKGEIDWALSVARTATLLYPTMAEAWQTQGRLLCHLGFFSEAEPPLKRALKLDPRSPTVHEILGRLAFAQQRNEDAIHHYRQSVLLGMPGEQILIELAMAYLSQGSSKESALALYEALRRNPRNGTAQGMLDRLQRGSGTFQALVSGKPSP
jgi:Tfp pilus assembly protein PilF